MQFVRRCYGLRGIYGRFDSKIRFEIESDGRFDSRFDSNAKKTICRSLPTLKKHHSTFAIITVDFYNFCTAVSMKNTFSTYMKNIFTLRYLVKMKHHFFHVHEKHLHLTLPCENETSHFILL